ncbi:DUF397 domain-containing protein [Streptomyces sp. NPDC059479]|uniref:DUF397 domain-containing protein n=1 Tax=Streptomyces sp. NPDC059479 TaxID=3346848 RepID=UPI0036BAD337
MTRASTLPVEWQKSSYSTNGGNCVEIGVGLTGVVPVRDSKDLYGPALMFPTDAWGAFVSATQRGEFATT